MTATAPVRVLMTCTGIGRMNRGIETFFREAFDGLSANADRQALDLTLAIGAGDLGPREHRPWSLSRNGRLTGLLGRLTRRDGYTVEQMSAIPAHLALIARTKPHVVMTSEANLLPRLKRLRRLTGVPFRTVYSNGAPMTGPFPYADLVHQVTPTYHEKALALGEPAERHVLVPYGFRVPSGPPDRSAKAAARAALGLPQDRPIVLSVGWIAARHKRMDYVVREVAALPEPRPHLVLLGAIDADSAPIIAEAARVLGPHHSILSVPPDAVGAYYRAADAFVLASLNEGFGRVYVEALGAGLPVIAHDFAVARWVLGKEARYGDLAEPGALTRLLSETLSAPAGAEAAQRRWSYAAQRYAWSALTPAYTAMLHQAATLPPR